MERNQKEQELQNTAEEKLQEITKALNAILDDNEEMAMLLKEKMIDIVDTAIIHPNYLID